MLFSKGGRRGEWNKGTIIGIYLSSLLAGSIAGAVPTARGVSFRKRTMGVQSEDESVRVGGDKVPALEQRQVGGRTERASW